MVLRKMWWNVVVNFGGGVLVLFGLILTSKVVQWDIFHTSALFPKALTNTCVTVAAFKWLPLGHSEQTL